MALRLFKKLKTIIITAVFILLLFKVLLPGSPGFSETVEPIPDVPPLLYSPPTFSQQNGKLLSMNLRLIKQLTTSQQTLQETQSIAPLQQSTRNSTNAGLHKFPSSLGKVRVIEITGGSPDHKQVKEIQHLDSNSLKYPEHWTKTLAKLQQQFSKFHLSTGRTLSATSTCKNQLCSEFLTRLDTPHFKYCLRKSKLKVEPEKSTCHFISGKRRSPIALASFPGSGNTWVRGLLQDITGICTGGIYCDATLRRNGYPGECIRSGVVLVVKTHQTSPWWTGIHYKKSDASKYFVKTWHIPVYSSAIFLMRNPFDALVAEWNRLQTVKLSDNHVNFVGKKYFGDNQEWNDFVHAGAVEWQETVLAWIVNNGGHPVIVVKYEDMKTNTSMELRRMLDFLQFPYSETQFQSVVSKGYNTFKRNHSLDGDFEHFTPAQRLFVNSLVRTTKTKLEEHGLADKYNLTSYLFH